MVGLTVSLAEAREMLDELIAELPPEIFSRLNGGVLLLPDVRLSAEARANDLYTLGEYEHSHALGRTVRIYYGSILRAHGQQSPEEFREALREVLHHELTHHLESMAGDHSLEDDDNVRMNWYRMRHKG